MTTEQIVERLEALEVVYPSIGSWVRSDDVEALASIRQDILSKTAEAVGCSVERLTEVLHVEVELHEDNLRVIHELRF